MGKGRSTLFTVKEVIIIVVCMCKHYKAKFKYIFNFMFPTEKCFQICYEIIGILDMLLLIISIHSKAYSAVFII